VCVLCGLFVLFIDMINTNFMVFFFVFGKMCIVYLKNVLSSTNTECTYVSALFQNIILYLHMYTLKRKRDKTYFFLKLKCFPYINIGKKG